MSESILIVDDEKDHLDMVCRLLEGVGDCVVEGVESAKDALMVVEGGSVDVVITDLKMPEMDGLELARRLLEQDPDRPVILMTAHADLDSAREAVGMGLYDYLTKPFDVKDMLAAVKRALAHRRLVQENRDYQEDLERKVEERTREVRRRVRELEARDALLKQLVSIHEPEETLGLAVKLALDLCACDAGGLYVRSSEGEIELRVSVGYKEEGVVDSVEIGLEEDGARLTKAWEEETVYEGAPGSVKRELGVQSFAILPVLKDEEVIALLDVGRKQEDAPVDEAVSEAMQGFLPYVAMAVTACRLQEELPNWGENVEKMLEASDRWTDQGM